MSKHSNAETRIKEINEAYDTLKDTEKRKSYNIQRGYSLNKKIAKENFNYKYDYKSGSFNKEKKSETSNENYNSQKDSKNKGTNEFKRENYDLIYNVIKKYIIDTQIKTESIKFPDINFIKFIDKSGIFFVEGHFTSKNWVDQTIKTTYSAKVTSQFKLLSMDFLNTREVYEKTNEKKEKKLDSSKKFRTLIIIIFISVFGVVKIRLCSR